MFYIEKIMMTNGGPGGFLTIIKCRYHFLLLSMLIISSSVIGTFQARQSIESIADMIEAEAEEKYPSFYPSSLLPL